MIWESGPWRRDLVRDARLLVKWAASSPSERRDVLLEKKVFLTAYCARKLLEAKKVPDSIGCGAIKLKSYPVKAIPTWLNWHKIDQNYDLSAPQKVALTVRELVNLIIHSFVMIFSVYRNQKVSGFFLASDRSRKSRLLYIPLNTYAKLCLKIATAEPKSFSWRTRDDGQELIVVK